MTIQELKYLVAVAEHLHFGRAAAACHVTQPTLSAGLSNLERKLELVLCERGPHGVRITREGEPVVSQARRVLSEVRHLQQLAASGQAPLTGEFRLGAIPTIGPYLFPHVIAGVRKAWPNVRLNLVEDKTADLVRGVRQGDLDAVLLSPPFESDGLAGVRLYREDFLLALSADHPLRKKRTLRVADLEAEPLLLLDEGHCLRDQVVEYCRIGDAAARDLFRASSLETLRNMVAAGTGCTLLPALAVHHQAAVAGTPMVRAFSAPAPGREVGLYWRAGRATDRSAAALADTVRGLLPDRVRPLG